jgi:hypothetical protein
MTKLFARFLQDTDRCLWRGACPNTARLGSPTATRAVGRVCNYFSTLMGSGVHEDSA